MVPANRWNKECNLLRRGYYLFMVEKPFDNAIEVGFIDRYYCRMDGSCIFIRTYDDDGRKEFDMWHEKDEKFLVRTGIMFKVEQRK